MDTTPRDLTSFRGDLRQAMSRTESTQKDVERITGVAQGIICNFLSGKRGLSGDSVFKLWPFVYPEPPAPTPAPAPAPPAEADGGDDAAET